MIGWPHCAVQERAVTIMPGASDGARPTGGSRRMSGSLERSHTGNGSDRQRHDNRSWERCRHGVFRLGDDCGLRGRNVDKPAGGYRAWDQQLSVCTWPWHVVVCSLRGSFVDRPVEFR